MKGVNARLILKNTLASNRRTDHFILLLLLSCWELPHINGRLDFSGDSGCCSHISNEFTYAHRAYVTRFAICYVLKASREHHFYEVRVSKCCLEVV